MSSSSKDPQKEKERKRLVAENRRIREKQEKQLKEGISKRNTETDLEQRKMFAFASKPEEYLKQEKDIGKDRNSYYYLL
jgi:hypothetical protein